MPQKRPYAVEDELFEEDANPFLVDGFSLLRACSEVFRKWTGDKRATGSFEPLAAWVEKAPASELAKRKNRARIVRLLRELQKHPIGRPYGNRSEPSQERVLWINAVASLVLELRAEWQKAFNRKRVPKDIACELIRAVLEKNQDLNPPDITEGVYAKISKGRRVVLSQKTKINLRRIDSEALVRRFPLKIKRN
jgi:hypothetical protein